MFYRLDKVKPAHILSLVFAVFITATGVTLGIVSINQSQEYRSLASGSQTPAAGCNQPCRANRDCDVGLRCYYGTCRLADNPQDETCQPASTHPTPFPSSLTPKPTSLPTVAGCNQTCQTNADCDVNLMCFQGHCRLADQPDSSTCGQEITPTANPTSQPVSPTQSTTYQPDLGQTALNTFFYYFMAGLEQIKNFLIYVFTHPKYRLPAFTFLAGLVLIVIALLLRHKQTKPTKKTPHLTTTDKTQKPHTSSTMTTRLKKKQVKPPK